MARIARWPLVLVLLLAVPAPSARGQVTREEVEKAIQDGVRYLKKAQRADGSWRDFADEGMRSGTTSLVTLALLTAGESAGGPDPTVARALAYLEQFSAAALGRTYTVALQTMAFAAADPQRYRVRILDNVKWLERAQHKATDREWPGSWSYTAAKAGRTDNSNTQYALLGLNAATEAGVPVQREVWALTRDYWERYQNGDGGWGYMPSTGTATASMTCAGVSSLIIAGMKQYQGREALVGEEIRHCGEGSINPVLQRGVDWLATNFRVDQNLGSGRSWKYYYLYGLERAGRLSGLRFFGNHDWYREGAEELVHAQNQPDGKWTGLGPEDDPLVATSFALLFLAKGRAPVLVNKLRHGPGTDWNNDPDDIRNLVGVVSRDWQHLLTWQVVDPNTATVEDLLQAPIAYLNGHRAPVLGDDGIQALRTFIEQGGFLLAEACCGRQEFDDGFRALMKAVFPEADQNPPEYDLKELAPEHPIWRAKHVLSPEAYDLWGIEHGCRTVVVYSRNDLSCFWNQAEALPNNPAVIKGMKLGQNIVDYATGRELPADKLTVREVHEFRPEAPKRGALYIAKLRHAGDWNVAPLAIPNLTTALREKLGYDVVINHRELLPSDPAIINYPLIYIHGRAALSFSAADLAALRRHLEPGGGTIFADAACGSAAFDAAFRRFLAALLPEDPLVPIPPEDELYTKQVAFDLSDVQYSKAAGGGQDRPQLEGVKIGGRWGIIYSRYDIGCALERQQGLDCKGYDHESALRIAANIVVYATLP